MEHYAAIERNEALMYAITWMYLENSISSERSQTTYYMQITYYRTQFTGNIHNSQIGETVQMSIN